LSEALVNPEGQFQVTVEVFFGGFDVPLVQVRIEAAESYTSCIAHGQQSERKEVLPQGALACSGRQTFSPCQLGKPSCLFGLGQRF
jgi:hypothetical protein